MEGPYITSLNLTHRDHSILYFIVPFEKKNKKMYYNRFAHFKI